MHSLLCAGAVVLLAHYAAATVGAVGTQHGGKAAGTATAAATGSDSRDSRSHVIRRADKKKISVLFLGNR